MQGGVDLSGRVRLARGLAHSSRTGTDRERQLRVRLVLFANPSGKARFLRTAAVRDDGLPRTTAGTGVFQTAKVVVDILRLIAELQPPPVTSTA